MVRSIMERRLLWPASPFPRMPSVIVVPRHSPSVALPLLSTTLPRRAWSSAKLRYRGRSPALPSSSMCRTSSSQTACAAVEPPEALTTPDPLFTTSARGQKNKSQLHHRNRRPRPQPTHSRERRELQGDRHVLQTVLSGRSPRNLQRRPHRNRRQNRILQSIEFESRYHEGHPSAPLRAGSGSRRNSCASFVNLSALRG